MPFSTLKMPAYAAILFSLSFKLLPVPCPNGQEIDQNWPDCDRKEFQKQDKRL